MIGLIRRLFGLDGLNDLSPDEARRRSSEVYRRREEPRLRKEERKLGTPDWETLSWPTLIDRSLARYHESKRPGLLRQAGRYGVEGAEKMSTRDLDHAVLREQVRRNNIRDIRWGG